MTPLPLQRRHHIWKPPCGALPPTSTALFAFRLEGPTPRGHVGRGAILAEGKAEPEFAQFKDPSGNKKKGLPPMPRPSIYPSLQSPKRVQMVQADTTPHLPRVVNKSELSWYSTKRH